MTYDPNPRFPKPDLSCPGCGETNPAHCHCGDIDDDDPGPHTCIYVGVDNRDECEICGRDSDPFRDLHDDFDPCTAAIKRSKRRDCAKAGVSAQGSTASGLQQADACRDVHETAETEGPGHIYDLGGEGG